MSEEKTKVQFYMICSDRSGCKAMFKGEGDWFAMDMEDAYKMKGFLIDNLYELALSSDFADQRMLITDEEFTKLAKHSHQFISVNKTQKP